MRPALLLAVTLGASAAHAQSTVYGLDIRNGMFFTSDTGNFVTNYTPLGVNQTPIFAIDFEQTATTLWGIDNATLQYGTFDLLTGLFTSSGVISGATLAVTGLTCSPNGTWYLSEYDATSVRSFLYVGDVTTGTFSFVGFIAAGIIIDISMSSSGQLYGHSISTDSIYSINTTTGTGTLIGPTGLAANFAQGMDFDWSTGTLYAAIYTTTGAGAFCSIDLTNGMATILADTLPLDGEFEFSVQEASSGLPGTAVCFGDGSGAACGCLNESDAGTGGCRNSVSGTQGAFASVASGTAGQDQTTIPLTFQVTNVRTQPGLFFCANNTIGGGAGSTFGDGLRCCGGSLVRVENINPPVGPEPVTVTTTSTFTPAPPGTKRCYQYWYRDPGGPCGANFNLSNAVTVTWGP